jgi:hypothetical protein
MQADPILTGGLLDRISILVDDDPFPVRRFIAHNDDIAFETRNIFRDERLALRRNENPVTDWANARRHRIELYHDVPAVGSLKDRVACKLRAKREEGRAKSSIGYFSIASIPFPHPHHRNRCRFSRLSTSFCHTDLGVCRHPGDSFFVLPSSLSAVRS